LSQALAGDACSGRGAATPDRIVAALEGVPHRPVKRPVDPSGVAEADLDLLRVDVDVDLRARQLDEEVRDGLAAGDLETGVRFPQRVREDAVAHPASVDEEVLSLT
jgi:hypothetical protein